MSPRGQYGGPLSYPLSVNTKPNYYCFQLVQDDMSKARSVSKYWEFVSKGTEISLGRFVSEFFTPFTLDSNTGVISDEDTVEIWGAEMEVAIEKDRRNKNKTSGEDSTMIDVREVERSFWQTRWVGCQQENEENHPPRIQEDH